MKIIVTGSGGLIGGEVAEFFAKKKNTIYGIDNNMRADFFGKEGDTTWRQNQLKEKYNNFKPFNLDIRNRQEVIKLIEEIKPDVIIHCAAQPSHDLAAKRPFDDFDVNAVGTLNLLESIRRFRPDGIFVYLSTNKVYGDAPNRIKLKELPKRWDYDDPDFKNGINESFTIDHSKH